VISGIINSDLEAIVRLWIRGPLKEIESEAIVDTGFNGTLVLSPELIAELGLSLKGRGERCHLNLPLRSRVDSRSDIAADFGMRANEHLTLDAAYYHVFKNSPFGEGEESTMIRRSDSEASA